MVVGVGKGVLFREFRGVLIEEFHCSHIYCMYISSVCD